MDALATVVQLPVPIIVPTPLHRGITDSEFEDDGHEIISAADGRTRLGASSDLKFSR